MCVLARASRLSQPTTGAYKSPVRRAGWRCVVSAYVARTYDWGSTTGWWLDGKLAAVFCEFRATKFMPVSQAICERAVALTKHYGKRLYGYDAIHLATALEYKVKAFVTNDKTLLNLQVNELDIKGL